MKGLIINKSKYIRKKETNWPPRCFAGFLLLCLTASFLIIPATNSTPSNTSNTDGYISNLNAYSEANKEEVAEAIEDTNMDSNEDIESGKSIDSDKGGGQDDAKKPEIIRRNIPETYLVTKVVDGDTIYVAGISTRIRLIGVNTPETVNTSKPVGCYGPEASNYLKSLLLNKYVGLEADENSGDMDIYGRPLRYVYLNGENVNQKLILEGYGKEADYGSDYKYHAIFLESQEYAIFKNLGLWSPYTCDGVE